MAVDGRELSTIKTRLDYLEKGIEKTECALNKRLEGMNEFRSALKDQNNLFITRIEYDSKHESLVSRIELLQRLVYIGVGILLVLEIFLRMVMK